MCADATVSAFLFEATKTENARDTKRNANFCLDCLLFWSVGKFLSKAKQWVDTLTLLIVSKMHCSMKLVLCSVAQLLSGDDNHDLVQFAGNLNHLLFHMLSTMVLMAEDFTH